MNIYSLDLEEERSQADRERPEEEREEKKKEKKEEEDMKCVICLEEKLVLREFTKRDGTMARQFHRAPAQKLLCCRGYVHNSCLMRWVEETGRLVMLFKCPHCRSIGCDLDEMEAFQEGFI